MLPQAPDKPGVYLIKDSSGKIIYVGKAISIAKRIKAHFRPDSKIAPHIADLDYIVTSNELEALILEAVLIKKHHPRYNVLLRDDKQYPYMKLTVNEEWPSISLVRKIADDGAKYFGPYRSQTVKDIFRMVKRLFRIRWCKTFKKRDQPCFYYHMGKCLAPCARNVPRQQYLRAVKDIELFLEGKFETAIKKLEAEMALASQNKDYEAAAEIRDRLKLFRNISEEQKIVTADRKDKDVFFVSTYGNSALALILEIRGGKLTGKQSYFIKDTKLDEEDILTTLMVQYYSGATYVPPEVIASAGGNKAILEGALSKLKGSKVRINISASGKDKGLLKMAEENSNYALQQNIRIEGNIYDSLFDLKRSLNLEKMPYRIEAFDISTTMGVETVGSMAVFEGGLPLKSDYRKFKVAPGRKANNDVAGIRNIVMRRYTGKLSTQLASPDLVLIDGGLGQLNAAKPFIPKGSAVLGLAKKLEEIYMTGRKGPIRLDMNSPALKLLRRIRDEAHRFAITFHRKRRAARTLSNG
jgi:excinuclease ABC subunit C